MTDADRTNDIIRVIESIVETMEGDLSGPAIKLYHEFESLAIFIKKEKAEIASLCPDEIQAKHIPSATDELDAIVLATERATGDILDSAEKIEATFEEVSEDVRGKLNIATTAIYEACNFQDITGQRISKIVATLREIEAKIESLITAFSPQLPSANKAGDADSKKKPASLLNGPALPGEGKSQEEIDALLSDFD